VITFNYETDFELDTEEKTSKWIQSVIENEDKNLGEINYIFCDDAYLHNINVEFLNHDDYTDIISFDYTMGKTISGDIYISVDRVKENAKTFGVSFENELHRVIIHGVLHYLGWKDKTAIEKTAMRNKENDCLLVLSN
jgi:rRNA maturation RNase YbeY